MNLNAKNCQRCVHRFIVKTMGHMCTNMKSPFFDKTVERTGTCNEFKSRTAHKLPPNKNNSN